MLGLASVSRTINTHSASSLFCLSGAFTVLLGLLIPSRIFNPDKRAVQTPNRPSRLGRRLLGVSPHRQTLLHTRSSLQPLGPDLSALSWFLCRNTAHSVPLSRSPSAILLLLVYSTQTKSMWRRITTPSGERYQVVW